MDRIHHVKIASSDPTAVEEFLTEVVRVPKGFSIGTSQPIAAPDLRPEARETLDWEEVFGERAANTTGGLMVGDNTSRQFQVLLADDRAHIWSVAIGTRDLEGAHERSLARGIPTTDPDIFDFGKEIVRAFFARVGGILFEVMRVEPKGQASPPTSRSHQES